MRKFLTQVFGNPNAKPDAVQCELDEARARNKESATALDDTIHSLLEANRRDPFRAR